MALKNICCGCCCYPENENIPLKDLIDYSAVIQEQEKRNSFKQSREETKSTEPGIEEETSLLIKETELTKQDTK